MADAMSDIPDFNRFLPTGPKDFKSSDRFFFLDGEILRVGGKFKNAKRKIHFYFYSLILKIWSRRFPLNEKLKNCGLMPHCELWIQEMCSFPHFFSYMLWDIELKFCMWLCFNVLQIKFKCRHSASVWLSFCSSIFCSCLLYESGWNLKFDSGLFNVFLLE